MFRCLETKRDWKIRIKNYSIKPNTLTFSFPHVTTQSTSPRLPQLYPRRSITRYPQNPNPSDFCSDLTRLRVYTSRFAPSRGDSPCSWPVAVPLRWCRKDDGLNGSPGQGRVQLRPVPPQQYAGEERAQTPGIQEDRNNHRRPRLSGATAPTLVASPFRIPVITMYVFCWSSGTRFCEFGRLELCAAVCSCFLGLQTAF